MHGHHATLTVGFIVATITILIVAQIVLQILIAAFTRNRLKDERDRLIRLQGYHAAYFTVISLMVCGMGALWLIPHCTCFRFATRAGLPIRPAKR